MTAYLDASLVVSLVAEEADSPRVDRWVVANAENGLATSDWVSVEVASALSIKVRSGALNLAQQHDAADEWRRLRAGLVSLPIDAATYATAESWAGRPDLGLRAGDALHLAIARAAGCALATLDRTMAEAARTLGVSVAEV